MLEKVKFFFQDHKPTLLVLGIMAGVSIAIGFMGTGDVFAHTRGR